MKTERLYAGTFLDAGDAPCEAVEPSSRPEAREYWGWKQDERSEWYRDMLPGQRLADPPPRQAETAP